MMNWSTLCVILHLLAVSFWFGHMFFWSLVVGPITKRFTPPEEGRVIHQMSLRWGGLGWPALFVLVVTGVIMLSYRGLTLQSLLTGELLANPFGRGLAIKLFLVAWMICYQLFIGHMSAPRLIYVNMIAALVILAVSIILVRAPSMF